jgi:hypothetical protein
MRTFVWGIDGPLMLLVLALPRSEPAGNILAAKFRERDSRQPMLHYLVVAHYTLVN